MVEPWLYRALVVKVVDGDTLDLYVDLGFGNFREQRFRLKNVDCPELPTLEGKAARDYTAAWLGESPGSVRWPFVVRTFVSHRTALELTDNWRRYEAQIFRWYSDAATLADLPSLTADLVAAGHASPWP